MFMNRIAFFGFVICVAPCAFAADPPAPEPPPAVEFVPGQVIIPTQAGQMRRRWGELISLDEKTRTGKFRDQDTEEVIDFVIMPYAELLHHAYLGDIQDFIVGERGIFRLHRDKNNVWRYLTYIQDEMNFMNGHKEFYHIDKIDRATGTLTCHQGSADGSFVREPVVIVTVDANTKYFRNGKPTTFDDVKVGDKLQTKSHGTGKGKERVVIYAFLDVESLQVFQAEQQEVHRKRMLDEGFPGYADTVEGNKVTVTLFLSARDYAKEIKKGMTGRLAPTGVDRKPTAEPIDVTVTEAGMKGSLAKVTVECSHPPQKGLEPTAVIRLWLPEILEKK